MMEFDSWDDDIPNMMGKIKFMFQTTNQLYYIYIYINYIDGFTKRQRKLGSSLSRSSSGAGLVTGGLFPVWAGNAEQTRTSRDKKSSNPKGIDQFIDDLLVYPCWFVRFTTSHSKTLSSQREIHSFCGKASYKSARIRLRDITLVNISKKTAQ